MYVCLCGDVTEEDIIEWISNNPNASAEQASDALGAGVCCGKCRSELYDIILSAKNS